MNRIDNIKQNKINNFIINHPVGEDKAKAIRKNLLKSACKFFYPFKEYFSIHNVEYLVQPKPTYIEKQPLQEKLSLSIPKQMEYMRGAVKQYIDQQYLQNILKDDYQDRGLVENHKNKSLVYKNILIYASDFHLKSIALQISNFNSSQVRIYQQFPERIFEIVAFKDNLIVIRCRYWVFLFDVQKSQVKKKIRFNQQVTTISLFKNDDSLFATTFDQTEYKLYQWNFIKDSLTVVRSYQHFWGAHSTVNLNSREFIIGFANKIVIEDIRTDEISSLKRVMQIGNDRYTSLIQLCHSKNKFVVGRTKFIDIFDLRNSQNSLLSTRHFCQQSPPSCLISLTWKRPILIAYSPSQLGSSLILNIEELEQQKQTHPYILYQQNIMKPTLLFDSGKIYEGLHPKSICPIVNDDVLTLIHIDSGDGVSMQVLKRSSEANLDIIRLQSSEKKPYPEQPCKKWSEYKNLETYLRKKNIVRQDGQTSSSQESIQESQIFMKKNNYCSLDKFRNRIFELASLKEGKKQNQNQLRSTYFSESLQGEQNWAEIIRYVGKNNNQTNITDQLLDYLQQQWKI